MPHHQARAASTVAAASGSSPAQSSDRRRARPHAGGSPTRSPRRSAAQTASPPRAPSGHKLLHKCPSPRAGCLPTQKPHLFQQLTLRLQAVEHAPPARDSLRTLASPGCFCCRRVCGISDSESEARRSGPRRAARWGAGRRQQHQHPAGPAPPLARPVLPCGRQRAAADVVPTASGAIPGRQSGFLPSFALRRYIRLVTACFAPAPVKCQPAVPGAHLVSFEHGISRLHPGRFRLSCRSSDFVI